MTLDRRRVSLLVFAVLGAALYFVLAPRWPKDQSVNVVLGDGAGGVREVTLRYEAATGGEDWSREATFLYAQNRAPRVVHHAPRLPDGDYVVDIELRTAAGGTSVSRNVALRGGSTSIDVADALASLAARAGTP